MPRNNQIQYQAGTELKHPRSIAVFGNIGLNFSADSYQRDCVSCLHKVFERRGRSVHLALCVSAA